MSAHPRCCCRGPRSFLPVGIIRFLLDVALHYMVCLSLERMHGFWVVAGVYILSGVGGNLTGAIFLPQWLDMGPNGALFGCMGAMLCIMAINWQAESVTFLKQFFIWLALALVYLVMGAFPGTDNWSSIGGLITGFLVALTVFGSSKSAYGHLSQRRRGAMRLIGGASVVVLLTTQLVLLYTVVDDGDPCVWCAEASCFPALDWCTPGRLGANVTFG